MLGLLIMKNGGTIKVVNFTFKPVIRIAEVVPMKIGDCQDTLDFSIVPMDDFKVVLGLAFFYKALAFLVHISNSLIIFDEMETGYPHAVP